MIAGGASLAPEAVVLAGVGDARAEEVGVDVDRPDDRQEEREELGVGVRVVARVEQVLAVVGAIDQLLCLPEPLMPANGFSWMRNIRPCCGASRRIMLITIMLWSDPTDVAS